jgi:hypothetical protein
MQVATILGVSIRSILNIRKESRENILLSLVGKQNKVSPETKEALALQFKSGLMSTHRDSLYSNGPEESAKEWN